MFFISEDSQLHKFVDSNTPGTSFPDTELSTPIIMFAKNNNAIVFGDDREFETVSKPFFKSENIEETLPEH